jgi:PAS domain S-box-containing protein
VINEELDQRVIQRTRDLADALSREHADANQRQAILTSIADGVIAFNPQGEAELANPASAAMLGFDLEEVAGQTAERVLQGVRSDDLGTILAIIHGDGPPHATLKVEWAAGVKTLSVSLANVVSSSGDRQSAGTVAVFRDITREAELDRMKSDFVSMVSHELRTPMTAIKGYVDLISAGTAGAVTETQNHFLEIIRSNVGRLANLVSDTLDLSRIEAGKIQLKLMPVSLVALVRQVVETLQQEFVSRSLKLQLELPHDLPMVYGDPDRLVQILTNLMSNAYKYTPAGTVTIRAHRTGDTVQVDVRDTGLGINPENQARLFTRFYRVRTPETDSIAGTGLGLSIVKSLVELHGGKIWLDSQMGKGSTFSFTVPCVPEGLLEAAQAEMGKPARARALPPPLVMVVDDDINAARLARHYLEEAGYAVTLVTRVEEVVDAASRKQPALILLDEFLPGKDGFLVLQSLKAEETTHDIPVVIASVLNQAADGLALGAAEYLNKPLDEHDLISVVNQLLGRGDTARSLLVVDDEVTLTEWLRVALSRYGYEVREARNGVRALEQYQAQRPDLIVLDLQMPEMDGREFLRQLRASAHGRQVPVIVLTGNRSLTQAERDELAALGTRAVLSKPLNVESLVMEIEGYLAHLAP